MYTLLNYEIKPLLDIPTVMDLIDSGTVQNQGEFYYTIHEGFVYQFKFRFGDVEVIDFYKKPKGYTLPTIHSGQKSQERVRMKKAMKQMEMGKRRTYLVKE